jgi:hypothetical protein
MSEEIPAGNCEDAANQKEKSVSFSYTYSCTYTVLRTQNCGETGPAEDCSGKERKATRIKELHAEEGWSCPKLCDPWFGSTKYKCPEKKTSSTTAGSRGGGTFNYSTKGYGFINYLPTGKWQLQPVKYCVYYYTVSGITGKIFLKCLEC